MQTDKQHKFEIAGLGKAPFKLVGYRELKFQACADAPVQPGGSCDYCGTAIIGAFLIKSSDGKTFKVGCDCVNKTGDAGLKRVVAQEKTKLRKIKDQARIATAVDRLWDPELREKLAQQPHPTFPEKTLLDWINWMIDHAGNAGKVRVARVIEQALAL